jgi:rubrerythrin
VTPAPTKKPERLLSGLRQAIQAEVQGEHFYRMAAQATQDLQGRQVFNRLADEEVQHQQFLRAQVKALEETGKPAAGLALGQPEKFPGDHPIFSAELRSRIGKAHYEMTALAIGIQLELNAEAFYRKEAKAARDTTVKGFFLKLADWEAGHYQALLRQQSSLKEDYWRAGGFAPF